MSSWTITWKRPLPRYEPPPIEPRVTYAPHIRGRIRRRGRHYYMQVLSHETPVAGDGPFPTLERALHETERVVAAARVSWMYGFGKKGLGL